MEVFPDYLLSHNLGTTGNMAVLYDDSGDIIKSFFTAYPTKYMHGNRVEQDANDWWKAVCLSTRGILMGVNEKSIASVSFSGQMMGCLCIDKDGLPLANSIIWADMRAEIEAEAVHSDIDEERFYEITGHRISPSYTLSKLLWIKNHSPEIYRRTNKVIQAKDYIVYKLTGNILTDYSDASGTNMFDLSSFDWSDTILSITGINRDILPDTAASTDIAGKVSLEAAAETGLLPGTPVVLGAGDGICACLGAGCVAENDAYLYFGSSAWIGLTKDKPYHDANMNTFNWAHIDRGRISNCGTMQAAGGTIDWLSRQIAGIESMQARQQEIHVNELIDLAVKNSPPGANNLLFLPYLLGERSPHWNPDAAGVLLGIKMEHRREDFFRAAVEGVAFNLRLIWDSLGSRITADELVLIGALGLSPVKKQILSDILGIRVVNNNHTRDSKSFGAALIAGIGTGLYKGLEDTRRIIRRIDPVEPDEERVELYNRMLPIFSEGYENLKDTLKKLSNLGGGI
ncbi:MAG: FGGY-family carbohydrate kinase [Spirochaetales bacterium]|nr:FGGY-family carbohydrate kinase [Spirochaetales bacterium]